jgi:hypothetical protein
MKGNIIEEQGPAPARSGQPEDSSQASEIAVGELTQVDVNVAPGVHQIF